MEESKIIDYLYGNLPENERQKVEEAIQNDDKLKKEIRALSQLKSVMGSVEDKEVIAPSFVFEENGSLGIKDSMFFKKTAAIAAGLVLIMVSAYFMEFNMSFSESGFTAGFNHSGNDINKEEIRAIMQDVLAENHSKTDAKIFEIETKLTQKIDESSRVSLNSMQKMLISNGDNSKTIMRAYVKQINKENLDMIQNFFSVSTQKQQQYLKTVLTDFNDFYQTQRANDLKMIESGLNDMQNTNVVKQFETDVVLANLMDIVKVKNK